MGVPLLSCVILAGGRSRRMGTDKALLKLPDGQSLLSRTVEIARRLCLSSEDSREPNIAIVTPWPDRYQSIIRSPVCWIEDKQEEGPLVGFSQAWSGVQSNVWPEIQSDVRSDIQPKIQSDWSLLLACDLPNLDEQVLSRWWQWLVSTTAHLGSELPEASLVMRNQRWEPLCGYYHHRCIDSMKKYLMKSDASRLNPRQERQSHRDFQSWLSTLNIATYSDVPNDMLFNCNRPVDWAKVVGK